MCTVVACHRSSMVTLVSENSAVMCDMFSCSCACCKRIMQLRLSDTVKRVQLGACSTTHFGESKRIQAKESTCRLTARFFTYRSRWRSLVTNFSCRTKPIRPIERAAVRRLTWSGRTLDTRASPIRTRPGGPGVANALGGADGRLYLFRHIVCRKLH